MNGSQKVEKAHWGSKNAEEEINEIRGMGRSTKLKERGRNQERWRNQIQKRQQERRE
jgi:hypothetical protein